VALVVSIRNKTGLSFPFSLNDVNLHRASGNRERIMTMDQQELSAGAKVMQALAHPIRLGVLQSLKNGEKSVSQLYVELECSQSMMSQQLQKLEIQGLIKTRKEGRIKYCSLANPEFLELFDCLRRHVRSSFGIRWERDLPEESNH